MFETQWFWLILAIIFILIYFIIGRICDTISDIKIAKYSSGFSINSIEQLDDLINNLQQIKNEIVGEENKYEK